ncbi:MAG TPA: hypothetical protein PKJ62_04715 [Bacteroidia bacterium]|nr:hypothetical protein [Bacteroidia bacterium]HNS12590.1 hypothetical protein [Bacteroidia bacterium]
MKIIILYTTAILLSINAKGQYLNKEDSMLAGLNPVGNNVIISGYGEAKYSYDSNFETASFNLTRTVLFVGYRFNSKISLLTEIEIEDAKVDEHGGELAMEQCLIKFDLNKNNYLLAGLFIPRIGIINENHLPTTFNGNDRHVVERMVIPSTWRELGIAYYGNSNKVAGLNWSLALMNGLNAEGLAGGKGLRSARFSGRDATASNLAATASLLYFNSGLRLQASAYTGGSVGLTPRAADSLGLDSGPFGTPVNLAEVNAQYSYKGITAKALVAICNIPDADKLNTAYAANTPESMYGFFAELGYNLLESCSAKKHELILFARYEMIDLMKTVPENGIKDELYKQNYLTAGLTYLPIRNVAIKFDWKHVKTGDPNPALIFAPNPNEPAYEPVNNFYQLGFAYSF